MKVSDYVAEFLVKQGVKLTFGITGGAIVHILDSIYRNAGIEHICTHHEQAAAMAADAYSRITGNIGVGISTSGPGATNLLTGVCCSYYDSIPTVFITGQVPCAQLKKGSRARQIGFQETDVVSIFEPVTKYCTLVHEPRKIRCELEKAFYIARHGRPGPVLLDICDDVQRADVDPQILERFAGMDREVFEFKPRNVKYSVMDENSRMIGTREFPIIPWLDHQVAECVKLLKRSKRPVIILGGGIRLAKAELWVDALIELLQFPVALTWAAMDMLPDDHPLLVRDFGVAANRAGNFAVQNADLILTLGTRLDTHETGSKPATFARAAKKIVVDIDLAELDKYAQAGMKVDVLVHADVYDFIEKIVSVVRDPAKFNAPNDVSSWMQRIRDWRKKYPICPRGYYDQRGRVNPYAFIDALSQESEEGDIVITDAGANLTQTMQGWKVKKGQRLFSAFNHSPMGYALPASIGAAFASGKSVICIIGDGGMQMNVQELATIAKHNLPIRIFVFNNEGYGIIRQTQDTWLESRHVASSLDSLGFPRFDGIGVVYGLQPYFVAENHHLSENVRLILDTEGPALCEVRIDPKARIVPKLEFGRPIEDASPLLDREEFSENMIVAPLDK